jgi:hypothetical protein
LTVRLLSDGEAVRAHLPRYCDLGGLEGDMAACLTTFGPMFKDILMLIAELLAPPALA